MPGWQLPPVPMTVKWGFQGIVVVIVLVLLMMMMLSLMLLFVLFLRLLRAWLLPAQHMALPASLAKSWAFFDLTMPLARGSAAMR